MTKREIADFMNARYPEADAEPWDNVGRLVGDFSGEVSKVAAALDLSDEAIDFALETGADLIITHHPILKDGIRRINEDSAVTRRIMRLIKNDICLYAAHTNFDVAADGTSATLAELIGFRDIKSFYKSEGGGYLGRCGFVKEDSLQGFSESVKKALNLKAVRVYGNPDAVVRRAGICAGSGMSLAAVFEACALGCNVFITGDVKFHPAMDALDIGMCVLDITHDGGELPAVRRLAGVLRAEFAPKGVDVEFFGGTIPYCNV